MVKYSNCHIGRKREREMRRIDVLSLFIDYFINTDTCFCCLTHNSICILYGTILSELSHLNVLSCGRKRKEKYIRKKERNNFCFLLLLLLLLLLLVLLDVNSTG